MDSLDDRLAQREQPSSGNDSTSSRRVSRDTTKIVVEEDPSVRSFSSLSNRFNNTAYGVVDG
jgi:hypothetical protein